MTILQSEPRAVASDAAARGVSRETPQTGSPSSPGQGEARRVARDSLVLTGGLASVWIVGLAVRLALPRFLDTATFGRLVFCESLALLLFAPLTLGMDTYARREVPLQSDVYPRLSRPIAVARSVSSGLLAAAGLGVLALLHRPTSVLVLFACYAVAQLLLNGSTVNAAFLQGGGKTAAATATQVVTKLTWAAVAVAGLFLGGGVIVVPCALAVSEGIRLIWLRRRNIALFGRTTKSDWRTGRLALVASLPFVAQQISMSLSNSLDTTLVGVFAGEGEVALYGAATLIASIALFLAPAITAALLPALSRSRATGGDAAVDRLGSTVLNVIVGIVTPGTILLALEADDVVRLIFGADYAAAVPSLRILALMFVLTYMASICSTILVARRRSWAVTLISVATVVVNTVGNLVLLGPATKRLGAGGPSMVASWAVFAAELVSVGCLLFCLGRTVLNRELFHVVLRAAGGCLVLWGVHVAVGGHGFRLLAVETTLSVVAAAFGAQRPIQAVRSKRNTKSGLSSRFMRRPSQTRSTTVPSMHSDAEPRRSSVDQPANAVAGRQNLSLTEDIKLFDTAKARAFGRNAIRSTKRHPFITMLTMASVVGLGGISWLAGPQTYQTMGVISARSGVVSSQIANPGRTINATSELPLANAKETVISEENIDQIIDQANLVNGLYDGETTLGRLRRNVFALIGSSPIDETAVRENLRIQLRTALTAQINGGSSGPDSLTISVYWPDAKGAAAIVQAAEDNFLANRRSAALGPIDDALTILLHYSAEADAEVDRLRTALDLPANDPRPIPESSPLRAALSQQADLSQRVRSAQIELDAAKAAFKYRYSVAQSPEVPTAPLSSPLKSYAMTIVLAMIAGIAAALLQDNRQRNRRSARQTDDSVSPSQAESLAATPVDDGNDGDSDDAVPTPLVSALQPKLEPAFLPDSPPEDGAIPSEFDRDDTDQRQIAEFLGDDLARDHEFMDDEFELSEDTLDELTGADNLTHRNVAV